MSRQGHSAGCVTLSDGTVVVSVFGGCTKISVDFIVSNPSFYQWGKTTKIVIQEDGSVLLLCSDPHHPSVLHCGLAPAGAVLRVTEHIGKLLRSLMYLLAY